MPQFLALVSGVNELALLVFAMFIAVSFGVNYWAARRTLDPRAHEALQLHAEPVAAKVVHAG